MHARTTSFWTHALLSISCAESAKHDPAKCVKRWRRQPTTMIASEARGRRRVPCSIATSRSTAPSCCNKNGDGSGAASSCASSHRVASPSHRCFYFAEQPARVRRGICQTRRQMALVPVAGSGCRIFPLGCVHPIPSTARGFVAPTCLALQQALLRLT